MQSEQLTELDLSKIALHTEPGESDRQAILDNERNTDMANARRLAKSVKGKWAYCHAMGKFLRYEDGVWRVCNDGEEYRLLDGLVVRLVCKQRRAKNEDMRRGLWHSVMRLESAAGRESVLKCLQSLIPVSVEELDADPDLLCVSNGTIDFKTGQLRPSSPEDWITKQIPIVYDPDAKCPRWERFLEEVLPGQPDTHAFLQRFFGYCLTGDTSEHVMLMMVGDGANGKSVMMGVLQGLLGPLGCTRDTNLLLERPKGGAAAPELVSLIGKRLVVLPEPEAGRYLKEGLTKGITGGDRISARPLYREPIEFLPQFKVVMVCNSLPHIRGTGHAIWRRIRVVQFAKTFPINPRVQAELAAEYPGILAWAVRGAADWRKQRLGEPESIRCSTEQYRKEQDVLALFIETACEQGPDKSVAPTALYVAYKSWCERNGHWWESSREFGRAMEAHGFRQHKGSGGARAWLGLAPLPAAVV